jgi:hypothetical protein
MQRLSGNKPHEHCKAAPQNARRSPPVALLVSLVALLVVP